MKVLLIAKSDWAFVGHTLAKCLRSVGVDATILTGKNQSRKRHKIRPGYCDAVSFETMEDIQKYAEEADIIQFMQGQFVRTGVDLSTKRVFVYYGGTNYRYAPEKFNNIFNPIVEKSIIQTGDLLGLGAKNEVWLLPAVDLDALVPSYEQESEQLRIAHYPTNRQAKNTDELEQIIKKLKQQHGDRFEFVVSSKIFSWVKHLERMRLCDIYIDACTPVQMWRKRKLVYGEWGLAALEAAALGKIVITHFLSHDKYVQEYGECGLKVANSFDAVEEQLTSLLTASDDELLQYKKEARMWVEKYHSLEAVGRKLKEEIYEI